MALSKVRWLDAREQLRVAHKMFTAMGFEASAERAVRELQATGEHAPKSSMETLTALTPHEAQIARFARDRPPNPEIGARLCVSLRTVEYHPQCVHQARAPSSAACFPAGRATRSLLGANHR